MQLHNELDGVLVVSLEQAVAAPYAGLLLADAGARVIKVERPEGDFARGYDAGAGGHSTVFAWLNRGKESVALDLRDENDLRLMRAMLARADVFISNLAPGAVARLGLDTESLHRDNPRLICVRITGYGETGDAANKKAYDALVQAESGVSSVTGTAAQPSRVGVSLTDLSTGLTAFSAVLRALIQRGQTGRGSDVSIAMFDVMADWMNMPLLAHRYAGQLPRDTVIERLDAAQIANANLNSVADVSDHPFLSNTRTHLAGHPIEMAALPIQGGLSKTADAPELDAHGAAIRAEFTPPARRS